MLCGCNEEMKLLLLSLRVPGTLTVSAGHTALSWSSVGSGSGLRNLPFLSVRVAKGRLLEPWGGIWYILWFINSVRVIDFVGDSNIPSRTSREGLCGASALCEINCGKNNLRVILSLYARKWCKKLQKSASWILEQVVEDFNLFPVNEIFM